MSAGANPDVPLPSSLPPALRRALDISLAHHPEASAELARELPVLFGERLGRQDDLPSWRLSRLTADGFPIELTFTTLCDGVRCTLEAFPRELPPAERVGHAVGVLATYGEFDPAVLNMVAEAQRGASLRFGAWVGVRHIGGRLEHKLYAEIPVSPPERAQALVDRVMPQAPRVPRRSIRLTMVGLPLRLSVIELYWSVSGLRPWELTSLMAPLGLQARAEAVMSHLEHACGSALHQHLPGPVFGCSHMVPLPGLTSSAGRSSFTFYGMAETLFGSGATTRKRLLRYFDAIGADMSYYADVSEPQSVDQERNLHGIFGLTVAADGPVVASIGLRPPDA